MSDEGMNNQVGIDKVESLRLILEREQHRPVTYEEALEVGESLISFFEVLAEASNEPESQEKLLQNAV